MNNRNIKMYQSVGFSSEILGASPHRLVQISFEHILSQLEIAKNHIKNKNVKGKCVAITNCLDMVIDLHRAVNKDSGGEIAVNLDRLYYFLENHLLRANIETSIQKLDEVGNIIATIKSGWDKIPENIK